MDEEPSKLVGARAKIERAAQLKSQGFYLQQQKNTKKKTSRAITIAIFYALAFFYAFLMMDAIETRFPQILQLIRLTGDEGIDRILVLISIAGTVMMLCGLIPALAFIWNKLTDNAEANVYLTVWGVGLVLMIVSFFLPSLLGGFSQVMGVFG